MSIDFITKDPKTRTSGGIAMDGLADADNPHSIMPPHSLRTFTMYLGGMIGEPVFLSAAVFEDGKEEGDKTILKHLRSRRTDEPNKKNAEARTEVGHETAHNFAVDPLTLIFRNRDYTRSLAGRPLGVGRYTC